MLLPCRDYIRDDIGSQNCTAAVQLNHACPLRCAVVRGVCNEQSLSGFSTSACFLVKNIVNNRPVFDLGSSSAADQPNQLSLVWWTLTHGDCLQAGVQTTLDTTEILEAFPTISLKTSTSPQKAVLYRTQISATGKNASDGADVRKRYRHNAAVALTVAHLWAFS